MDSATATRSPCFIEEDDGVASHADTEAGFSGDYHPFFSRPLYYTASLRNLSLSSPSSAAAAGSPRSGRWFFDGRYEEHQPHFLEACFLCKTPLGDNKDIFMYRGDTPFCSEECRQEQIEIDNEVREKNWNSKKALRKDQKQSKSKSTSPNKTQDYPFRPGTVAAA